MDHFFVDLVELERVVPMDDEDGTPVTVPQILWQDYGWLDRPVEARTTIEGNENKTTGVATRVVVKARLFLRSELDLTEDDFVYITPAARPVRERWQVKTVHGTATMLGAHHLEVSVSRTVNG